MDSKVAEIISKEADRQQEVIHIARQTTGPCPPWSCLLDYSTASLLDYQTSIPSTTNCVANAAKIKAITLEVACSICFGMNFTI